MAPLHGSALVPVRLSTLSTDNHLASYLALIRHAAAQTSDRLCICLDCPEIPASQHRPVTIHEALHAVLSALYIAASEAAYRSGHLLLSVDVVFLGWCGYDPSDADWDVAIGFEADRECIANTSIPFQIYEPPPSETNLKHLADLSRKSQSSRPEIYTQVAVGGTFDHLHSGHKVLLTMACWIARDRLVCGVVDPTPERLQRKMASQYMEPTRIRIHNVRRFLTTIRTGSAIAFDVVPIVDDLGPTRYESGLEAIVGSKETEKGCEMVNSVRLENGLKPLDIFIIDLISPDGSVDDIALKISSSFIRQHLQEQASQVKP
ncbi:uncharacterized protein BJ171DRAFT_505849 [Polychytrium aggregatum]|uniref:uncharacterized protein n=1 Tax=Polychytrium aggregatum TaxID=110093 RepID=UPI0022FDD58C|nr:uncharacterized protein BJ171DRAFT_505849 [Polychytrium aggregatum]KAI9204445.1 hypothetical protein BJ171DRAFT_505849 [Polychytrium aggregatum]